MKPNTLKPVFTSLFAALICAGSFIAIPIGPVPIVLQNAFAVLSGLLLGPIQGAGAVGLFILAGTLGLPVFSGGKSGFAVLTGPTGGYLAGYILAAFIAGTAARRAEKADKDQTLPIFISAALAGFACIYIPGVLVLKRTLNLSFADALAKGVIPFLAGDLIKAAIIIPLAWKVSPILKRYLNPDA